MGTVISIVFKRSPKNTTKYSRHIKKMWIFNKVFVLLLVALPMIFAGIVKRQVDYAYEGGCAGAKYGETEVELSSRDGRALYCIVISDVATISSDGIVSVQLG